MKSLHMDLKPQQIVDDELLFLIFLDLPIIGTCYYMSPEISSPELFDSESCKIGNYSSRVILY